ncbi:glycosyltransferase family 2 protein [Candidatus Pelagibacter sp. Uisw_130]|uniref:glycosyltransferase family 2 protein n=1 Tax=Candidatus Pelagibacter sp. Uisw_130 TaxID=3230989 RepID=UPI0039E7F2E7
MSKKISIIVSFYNEEESIESFITETTQELNKIKELDYEIIFINDCSTDKSLEKLILEREKNNKIKIINLSRRFGPMESIMAGIQMSTGDALVNLDIDLQDPPSLIAEMVKHWREDGFDVVFSTRTKRHGEPLIKKIISSIGYKILKKFTNIPIEKDSGDFRLISRKVITEYKKFSEVYPFFRFVVDWIGFKRKQIFYERKARRKGNTKHPLGLGIIYNFFEISFTPFTDAPLRFALIFGIISFIVCFIIMIRTLLLFLIGEPNISTTSLFVAILFFGSINSLILGILSIYIGSIFKDSKKRPLYIIESCYGFDDLSNKSNE